MPRHRKENEDLKIREKYTGLLKMPKTKKNRTKKQCFEEEKQKLCAKKVENTDFSC